MNTLATQARKKLESRRLALLRLRDKNPAGEQQALETRPADWPDVAQEQETAELLDRLSESERAELLQIDAALERVEQGTFGRCQRCGGAVGRQRLLAVPEARYCLTCEAQFEA